MVIPTHRDRGYLQETLQSVLRNIMPGDEVFIAANGVDDEYRALLQRLAVSPVQLLDLPTAGVAFAWNAGAKAATGTFLYMVDDDDLVVDGALARLRAALTAHPDWLAVVGDVELFYDKGPSRWRRHVRDEQPITPDSLLGASISTPGAVLMRREAFGDVVGFEQDSAPAEDWDFWLKLVCAGPMVGVQVPTLRFRVHAQGVSQQTTRMARAALTVFRRHLPAIRARSSAPACSWALTRFSTYYVPRLLSAARAAVRRAQPREFGRAVALLLEIGVLRVVLKLRAVLA